MRQCKDSLRRNRDEKRSKKMIKSYVKQVNTRRRGTFLKSEIVTENLIPLIEWYENRQKLYQNCSEEIFLPCIL